MASQIIDLFGSGYATGGEYGPAGVYTVIHSSSTSTLYVWQLGNSTWGGLLADHTISYDTVSKVWSDVGSGNPNQLCNGTTWANTTTSSANQQTLSCWQNSSSLLFNLTNPYYEVDTVTEGDGIPQLDVLNVLQASLTYDNATNKLSWIIPASFASTSDPLIQAHRTDYLLENTSAFATADIYLVHTQGTATIGSSNNSIAAGNWVIKRVISAPNASTSVNVQLIVTQAEIDAYNAAAADAAADAASSAAAAAAAAQAALDAANNAANTPPNTPRSRRGNLNFW